MTSTILKWLAAAGAAALAAGLKVLLAKVGIAPAGVDPLIGLVIVAVAVKLVAWLVAKIPAGD